MANEVALAVAAEVSIVESIMQLTAPAGEAITPGAPVRFDANGDFVNGNATNATENAIWGIATGKRAWVAGEPLTAVRIGVLDGFVFTSDAYGATIYLSDTDARLSTVVGTTRLVIGHVVPGTANLRGVAKDKMLAVCIVDDEAYIDLDVS
jgi:hypothetical protein